MPVRFSVAPHAARPVIMWPRASIQKPQDCLDATWGKDEKYTCAELLQSSLEVPAAWPPDQAFEALPAKGPTPAAAGSDAQLQPGQYLPSLPQTSTPPGLAQLRAKCNGFVDTVMDAYNNHHHLVIRPDDVWLAILSQFNFYVNANAEALRSSFVAHKGKKELVVTAVGNRDTLDFGLLAQQMAGAIHDNVIDKTLKEWILPDFTTTTENDIVTSAVMMMSTLKEYFRYSMMFLCGIPTVTLEGEKEDWEKLLKRIDRLKDFGRQPEAWSAMLRPILTRFVKAFDGDPDVDFWNHICHEKRMGSGNCKLGGWISAFCVWDKFGRWTRSLTVYDVLGDPNKRIRKDASGKPCHGAVPDFELDGMWYPIVDASEIPPGYCEVDVKLVDNEGSCDCLMVSGHVAYRVEGAANDAVRPHPSWFMLIKGPKKVSSLYVDAGLDL